MFIISPLFLKTRIQLCSQSSSLIQQPRTLRTEIWCPSSATDSIFFVCWPTCEMKVLKYYRTAAESFTLQFWSRTVFNSFAFFNVPFSHFLNSLPSLKYNVQKWERTFTLGQITAKNTHYVKNFFKQKLLRIQLISYKKVNGRICLSPPPQM